MVAALLDIAYWCLFVLLFQTVNFIKWSTKISFCTDNHHNNTDGTTESHMMNHSFQNMASTHV